MHCFGPAFPSHRDGLWVQDFQLAERACRQDPSNFRAWMERAMACASLQDNTCALEALGRASESLPDDEILSAIHDFQRAPPP